MFCCLCYAVNSPCIILACFLVVSCILVPDKVMVLWFCNEGQDSQCVIGTMVFTFSILLVRFIHSTIYRLTQEGSRAGLKIVS